MSDDEIQSDCHRARTFHWWNDSDFEGAGLGDVLDM